MKTVICLDRDGTLIYDKKFHLGRTADWKTKIQILDTVVEGLKVLRALPNTLIYLITNQPGVAVKNFPLLTEQRAREVCEHLLDLFKKEGVPFDGFFLCPHASPDWEKAHPQFTLEKELVCNCDCIKPLPGMVKNVLTVAKLRLEATRIYVVGDRVSDVKVALNVKGIGVLVPFENQTSQIAKAKQIQKQESVFIARDFLDAANFIANKEQEYKNTERAIEWQRERLEDKLDLDLLEDEN